MFLTSPDIHLVNSLPVMLSVYSKLVVLVFFLTSNQTKSLILGFASMPISQAPVSSVSVLINISLH